ncbi:hypothetical protein N7478_013087 [Penicillium angulare]|uniref:uncharacterized protein n=1 Tax=Penicillium angulare TaxID=116970 RepID=UPI0025401524|nr:uncharacterized protein N7478_013087 [Penicillium angulare]KAJ5256983.1 hypothetical protein N7478_013087 [Penicillium angulare]
MSSSDCFDIDQCQAAIEGRQVPETLESTWHRRATIRGIRSSLEFATSPSVTALCSGNEDQGAAFCRARNAMLIMSNMIPNLENPSHQPYCIWYPGFAREDTYREIARRYPSMRYQVGRSCAAAGYTTLYKELDLLPDVSIAEESPRERTRF